jgi:ribosomal-protein-alanine N-acetyltransferase
VMLTTRQLLLREFEESDWKAILQYQSAPEYLRYYHGTQRTEQEARAYVRMFMGWSKEKPRKKYQFALVLRSEAKLIGHCGLRLDMLTAGIADIGYDLDHHYRERGYVIEALHALLAFGFDRLALHRIWAACLADNSDAAHTWERLGMRREGRLRENEKIGDRWYDTLLYSLLDREWRHTG